MTTHPSPPITAAGLRRDFSGWLAEHRAELEPFRGTGGPSLEDDVRDHRPLLRLLYEAGWTRWGWPVGSGGLGGGEVLRAAVYDELGKAGLVLPEAFVLLETLAPVLTHFAPELAARHLPAYLRGDELWGQGFSEPDAGSDLAAIRTRAVPTGAGFVLSGQKIWTTLGQCAQWAAVLCRTEQADRPHRALSMLWVDLGSPGADVRPLRSSNGRNEFAEMFFTDVEVPAEHRIGERGRGWDVAMYLLQYERGMYAWLRQADLHRTLRSAVAEVGEVGEVGGSTAAALARAYADLSALRSRCSVTVRRLDAGETLGPETSIDKLLLSRAEQSTYDVLRRLRPESFALGDAAQDEHLRARWFYSRATSIFGGAAEVQRGIVAQRLLRLPREDGRGS